MKFGFIGAGNIAQTHAKHFVRHGHEVVLSKSKELLRRREAQNSRPFRLPRRVSFGRNRDG